MTINSDALRALELKLAEYSKNNGAIALHESSNNRYCFGCEGSCCTHCLGSCSGTCSGSSR